MYVKSDFMVRAWRKEQRTKLLSIRTGLQSCIRSIKPNGLGAEATRDLINTTKALGSVQLPPLDPVGTGDKFAKRFHDNCGNALLDGALPEDGGNSGTALRTTGNGACFFNAAATTAWAKGLERPSETDALSLPLRLALIVEGVVNLEKHINGGSSRFFRRMDAFDGKVTDQAMDIKLDLEPSTDQTYPVDVCRALLVISLETICGEYSDGSIFCLPLLAEALNVNVRCFLPVASIKTPSGEYAKVGGLWNKTSFSPSVGEVTTSAEYTLRLTLSFAGRKTSQFTNLEGFKNLVCLVNVTNHVTNETKVVFRCPEVVHFLAISPSGSSVPDEPDQGSSRGGGAAGRRSGAGGDGGRAGGRTESDDPDGDNSTDKSPERRTDPKSQSGPKRRRGRAAARPKKHSATATDSDDEDPTVKSWKELSRDIEYLRGVPSTNKTMPLGDEYAPRAQEMLSGPYDLGMPATSMPASLKLGGDTDVDVDYVKYGLLTEDLGTKFLHHLDTLCYQRPSMRTLDVPKNTKPLYLARGPGILYVLVETDDNELRSGRTTIDEEVEKARDEFVLEFRRQAPAAAIRTPSSPNLICRSHQTITGLLLKRILKKLGYNVVWHVQWGMKCKVEDLAELDSAAERAASTIDPRGDIALSNLFDIAATHKTDSIPVVTSWNPCRSAHGDKLAQPGATIMRCYQQAPGIFHRPFGSVQTRYGTPWPDVLKLTCYNKVDHILRAGGSFGWIHPETVQRGKRNNEYLRGLLDYLATPEGMALFKRDGLGLRVEVRVVGLSARKAMHQVEVLGILDPEKAWEELGQFQLETSVDVEGHETTIKHLPLWLVPLEVWLANAMRVTQAAAHVLIGSHTKKPTAKMETAATDVFAAVGRTHRGRRASTGLTLGTLGDAWWVHDVEVKRVLHTKGGGVVRRTNPSRKARRPPVKELSSKDMNAEMGRSSGESDTDVTEKDKGRPPEEDGVSTGSEDADGGRMPEGAPGRGRQALGSTEHPGKSVHQRNYASNVGLGEVSGTRGTPNPSSPVSGDQNAWLEQEEEGDLSGTSDYPGDTDGGAFSDHSVDNQCDFGGRSDGGGGFSNPSSGHPQSDEESLECFGWIDYGVAGVQTAEEFHKLCDGGEVSDIGQFSDNDIGGDSGSGPPIAAGDAEVAWAAADLRLGISGQAGSGREASGVAATRSGSGNRRVSRGDEFGGSGRAGGPRHCGTKLCNASAGSKRAVRVGSLEPGSVIGGVGVGATGSTATADETGSTATVLETELGNGGSLQAVERGRGSGSGVGRGTASSEELGQGGGRPRPRAKRSPSIVGGAIQVERVVRSVRRRTTNIAGGAAFAEEAAARLSQRACRALPPSELRNMRNRVRIRAAPFSGGSVTWTTKPRSVHSRRPGSGVACTDEAAVYLKLWELYGYNWPDAIP